MGISVESKERGRETRKEADCRVQRKMHRMFCAIVPWFSCCPFLEVRGSLRAGTLLGTSACPVALFCHSTEHMAMYTHTGLSGKEAATDGSRWVVLGNGHQRCVWEMLLSLLIL